MMQKLLDLLQLGLSSHWNSIPSAANYTLWFYCHFQLLTKQTVCTGCRCLTWKDLMKVQRRVLIPSPLLRSLTSLITLNKRKKVIEMRALSSVF